MPVASTETQGSASEEGMGVQLNIKNKITVNAVFKTTISVAIGTSSIIGTVIFYHRHEWAFVAVSLAVSALAWIRAFTRMPLSFTLFAWCGGTAEYEETPDGMRRMRLSHLPDSRLGVEIVLGLAVVAMAAVLIPGVVHAAAGATARTPSTATPTATAPARAGSRNAPGPAAVIQMYYTAVNRHDWLTVWRLWGNDPVRAHGAAYKQTISDYRCTVHDRLTKITSNGDSTLVRVRAQESDGTVTVVQTYRYSYVVRGGLIKKGTPLGHTGSPPPGCRQSEHDTGQG